MGLRVRMVKPVDQLAVLLSMIREGRVKRWLAVYTKPNPIENIGDVRSQEDSPINSLVVIAGGSVTSDELKLIAQTIMIKAFEAEAARSTPSGGPSSRTS